MGMYENGSIHQTRKCGKLKIIKYVDVRHRRVRFLDTGYEGVFSVSSIRSGSVKDPFVPSVYGIGYLGDCQKYDKHPLKELLKSRWRGMIDRVYRYGYQKTIDPDWLCLANFIRDALELKGVELLYQHSKDNVIDLDSDIIPIEKGIPSRYSKETCQWGQHAVNIKNRRIKQPVPYEGKKWDETSFLHWNQ